MRQLNKEQAVFTFVLILILLLLFLRTRGLEESSTGTIRAKSIDEVEWNIPDVKVVDQGQPIWSLEERDVFAMPREVVDLPPVEIPQPPLPPRDIVAPLLVPAPSDSDWHRLAQDVPESLATGQVVEIDDLELFLEDLRRRLDDPDMEYLALEYPDLDAEGILDRVETGLESVEEDTLDLGTVPDGVDSLARLFVAGGQKFDEALTEAPEVVQELFADAMKAAGVDLVREEPALEEDIPMDSPEGDPDILYDRLYRGSDVIYGRIQAEDPFELLVDDLGDDRFSVRPDAEIRFALVNARSGRRIGAAVYEPGQIDAVTLASTLDNQIRLRERRLSGDVRGHVALAKWCFERQAFDDAILHYRKAIDAGVGWNREAAMGLVEVYEADYRWDELAGFLRELGASQVENGEIEYVRGQLFARFGLDEDAKRALERCVELEPGRGGAWTLLADLRLEAGDATGALDAYQRAERAASADAAAVAGAIAGQAASLFAAGRVDEAISAVDRGLRDADPRSSDLRLLRSKLLLSDGRLDAAASALEGVASDAERDAELIRGTLAGRQRDIFDARSSLTKAVRMDRVEAYWPLVSLAFGNLITGRTTAGFDALTQALELNPDEPYGNYLLGRFHLVTGNLEEAKNALERARELAPEVTEILGELGTTHLRLDNATEARRFLGELARRRPESADAHAYLAVAHVAERNLREARASAEAALQKNEDLPLALIVRAILDYRDGGEGIYRAIGGLDRVVEVLGEDSKSNLAVFAKTYRAEIEDNRSKCQWWDGFNRVQIRRDWDVNQRHGVQVKLVGNEIVFEGTQRPRNEELTYLEREMEHRQVVRFEGRVSCPKSQKARAGLSVTVRRKRGSDELMGGIFFGRDTRGNLAYRLVERGEPKEWVVLEEKWPTEEWVALTIENHNVDEGHFRLLVDGREVAREIPVRVLRKPRAPVRVGVFGTSAIGASWKLGADDVRVVMIKEES